MNVIYAHPFVPYTHQIKLRPTSTSAELLRYVVENYQKLTKNVIKIQSCLPYLMQIYRQNTGLVLLALPELKYIQRGINYNWNKSDCKKLLQEPIGTQIELTYEAENNLHEKITRAITDSNFTTSVEITAESG